MKNKVAIFALCALTLMSCERKETEHKRTETHTQSSESSLRDTDNTARNVRDREFDTPTSGDQSESELDRTITQNIRKALMDKDNLSTNAKNVKIITRNSVVILRGVVETPQEKAFIHDAAKNTKNVKSVENNLEVNKS